MGAMVVAVPMPNAPAVRPTHRPRWSGNHFSRFFLFPVWRRPTHGRSGQEEGSSEHDHSLNCSPEDERMLIAGGLEHFGDGSDGGCGTYAERSGSQADT